MKNLLSLFIFHLSFYIFYSAAAQTRHTYHRNLMGSEFNLIFYAPNDSLANIASDSVFRRIEYLNQTLSDYLDGSEANRLSATAGSGNWVRVSKELFDILEKSVAVSKKTSGALDVSVGTITQLWRRAIRRNYFPQKQEIQLALQTVGYRSVKFNRKTQSILLLKKGTYLDFGAVGKGYAADEVLRVLKHFGITQALLDAGGDLAIGDAPSNQAQGWAIEVSTGKDDSTKTTLFLKNCGVATSGKTYRYIEHEGKRYSHIVSPQTGVGLLTHIRTTVIAPTGLLADALATAFSVLGIEKSKSTIAQFPKAKVWILEQERAWKNW